MTDTAIASVEPIIAPLPTPLSVEPRVAPAEAAEIARQAEEAKLPKSGEPKAAEPTKDADKKPLSTREALRVAREKVEAEPVQEKASPLKTEPKAAEPVKESAKESAKATDTKATESAKETPVRGADGKFVSADAAKATESTVRAAEPTPTKVDTAKEAEAVKAEPKPSFTAEPAPKRFAKVAQDRWAEAPDEVRAEVSRMERELTAGFEKHRVAAARDADIAEFHDRAVKGGTTVKAALSAYVGMEDTLRNPETREKGLESLFQNIGISPREWATRLLDQAPDAVATKADATILELRNEIAELKRGFGAIQQERTQAKTDSTTEAVTKFASDPTHSRFDELSEDIAFFLKTRCPGDLAKAYELAERLNPAPVKAESVVTTPVVASSALSDELPKPTLAIVPVSSAAGQKSIAGAPTAGSDPARKQPSSTIREALRRAQQRAV